MEEEFVKHQLKPGDPGFVYDKQVRAVRCGAAQRSSIGCWGLGRRIPGKTETDVLGIINATFAGQGSIIGSRQSAPLVCGLLSMPVRLVVAYRSFLKHCACLYYSIWEEQRDFASSCAACPNAEMQRRLCLLTSRVHLQGRIIKAID